MESQDREQGSDHVEGYQRVQGRGRERGRGRGRGGRRTYHSTTPSARGRGGARSVDGSADAQTASDAVGLGSEKILAAMSDSLSNGLNEEKTIQSLKGRLE